MMKYVLLVVALLMPVAAFSATPQIRSFSGTFETDSTFTLNGTDFGTKSPATPFLWDDFEGEWQWPKHPGTRIPPDDESAFTLADSAAIGCYHYVWENSLYDTDEAHSGATCFANIKATGTGDTRGGPHAKWSWDSMEDNALKAFVSFIIRIDDGSNSLMAPTSKTLRIGTWYPNGDRPDFGTAPGVRAYEPLNDIGLPGLLTHHSDSFDLVGPSDNVFDDPDGEYFSVSIWGSLGTEASPGGSGGFDFNGVTSSSSYANYNAGGVDGSPYGYRSVAFCYYYSNQTDPAAVYIDEAYCDTSLARITANNLDPTKIGVSGVGGGQTAMQIPVEWSDTQIKFIVNTSAYANGDILTLYVYNSNGEKSLGLDVEVNKVYGDPVELPLELVIHRVGTAVTLTWTAASETLIFDHYQVEVMSEDVLRTIPTGKLTYAKCTIPAANEIRAKVYAVSADGRKLGAGAEKVDTPE